MDLFTLKHAGKKYRMSLAVLEPAKINNKRDSKQYRLSCGAAKREGSRLVAKGLSLEGNVPLVELVRWARRKGFLKWARKGGAANGSNAQRGSAAKLQTAAGSGNKPKVAG